MVIGINASSALKPNPTGVEEYTYQLIKHLAMIPEARVHRFVLYLDPKISSGRLNDLKALPENFELRFLRFPFMWTQVRLALEMIFTRIDALLIPVHVLPFVHPKRSVTVLHGLEYEYFPKLYPFWHRQYLRLSTSYALMASSKVIAVSENTKKDLINFYKGDPKKISVVYHGLKKPSIASYEVHNHTGCILYIGRIEHKKNILGLIDAYNRLRKKNPKIKNRLALAGGKGFGYQEIVMAIKNSNFKNDILLTGYVGENQKNELWLEAAVFVFPSFYEGFGLPVLEAQSFGVPVAASNSSCLPEIAGKGAVFFDPNDHAQIADALEKVLTNEVVYRELIRKGIENAKRFSWVKCARETLAVITL